MKNLIYQNYTGNLGNPEIFSKTLFKEYADCIGADYRFDLDPNIASKHSNVNFYFEFLNFMFDDSFLEYDNVMIVDMDVYPVNGLTESIFDEFASTGKEFGICTEPFQGKLRETVTVGAGINKANDEKWNQVIAKTYGKQMPRDKDNNLKVYNAGMVLVSKQGMLTAREKFAPFQHYINTVRGIGLGKFYAADQNYFHSQMVIHGNYAELDNGWNGYVHYIRGPLGDITPIHDGRTKNSKFVHIQLSGASSFDDSKLYRITNLPMEKWML